MLLTRPRGKNEPLAELLLANGVESHCYPLIEIEFLATPELTSLIGELTADDIIIAISMNAVNSAAKQLKACGQRWPQRPTFFAVGQATSQAFAEQGVAAVVPQDPRTEGLLALPQLQRLDGKRVIILRGLGGRETLAEQLRLRGASVDYCQLYRRVNIVSDSALLIAQWRDKNVTTIVVTSAEILQNLLHLVNNSHKSWLVELTIIVPSPRVAKVALAHGLSRIVIASGANDQAILSKLLKLQSSPNEKK
ncbi:uroporphyrinogen-III synthase [Psychrobium sp. 1_MG-2023]|uniref:uroporphyrinogen-III synthase n=1 Tax=Psychrobium sp. 1_MG-2023 TaxID=3062624 RepID=UPI0027326F9E|nr:uroporphyrinogen-III synthase [Psychrobium sp. 1_MG-2023]MDP2559552.1 uroporphyrinogen-III synthase [Psychrobium sp. 1_MG-2023]